MIMSGSSQTSLKRASRVYTCQTSTSKETLIINTRFRISDRRNDVGKGLCLGFINRHKAQMVFSFMEQIERKRKNSGVTVIDKTPEAMMENSFEVMRAKYFPAENSFLIFAAGVKVQNMNENSCIAKLYWNQQRSQFILKNKYCQHCTQHGQYFCDQGTGRAWPFQQELGNFEIVSVSFISDSDLERGKSKFKNKPELHWWISIITRCGQELQYDGVVPYDDQDEREQQFQTTGLESDWPNPRVKRNNKTCSDLRSSQYGKLPILSERSIQVKIDVTIYDFRQK